MFQKIGNNDFQTFRRIKNIFKMFKSINEGSPGDQKYRNHEFGGSGPSHAKTEILLDQNEAE